MAKARFSESYKEQLEELAGYDLASAVTDEPHSAQIEGTEFTIEYVRLNAGADSRPVLYVPGFTEGIIAKAPFAAGLAHQGFDVTLPDQNRKKILADTLTDRKDATFSQAINYLSVLRAAELDAGGPVDVVTHSYGSMVFECMARIAKERSWRCFDDSNVVMLAPAGIVKESPTGLGKRWLHMMIAENGTSKDFQPSGEMLRAGAKNLAANVPRTIREAWELSSRRIDFKQLFAWGIGTMAALSYAEDPLYGSVALEPFMPEVMNEGVSWSEPHSLQLMPDGRVRGGKDASHNDEQFNPSRVVNAVAQILKLEQQKRAIEHS